MWQIRRVVFPGSVVRYAAGLVGRLQFHSTPATSDSLPALDVDALTDQITYPLSKLVEREWLFAALGEPDLKTIPDPPARYQVRLNARDPNAWSAFVSQLQNLDTWHFLLDSTSEDPRKRRPKHVDEWLDLVAALHPVAAVSSDDLDSEDASRRGQELLRTTVNPILGRLAPPMVLTSTGAVEEAAASSLFAYQPVSHGDEYEDIVQILIVLAEALERGPNSYLRFGEEELRDQIIIGMSVRYPGKVTGETYNKSGKTDILVRVDTRNVFIGECKWWGGPRGFAGPEKGGTKSALDQLLGYTTWQDQSLGLVIFVRAKGFGRVVAGAKRALKAHPAFIRWVDTTDRVLRAKLELPSGGRAELATVFVHLPS